MNRRKEDIDKIVDSHLGLFNSPASKDIAGSRGRTLDRLRDRATTKPAVVHSRHRDWRWRVSAIAAAAIVMFVVFTQWQANRNTVYAVVDAAGGGLYRVAGGAALRVGERIEAGEAVRTNGGTGTLLKLADGSSIEIRTKSVLSLDRAEDGVIILLSRGGLIVNAAKQRVGHLYVQTKDVKVSVVGTVFLVNAEEEGSRVAVIEGEVRVQQGDTEKKLLSGEQVASNPKMPELSVKEEIAWSRHSEAHLALLEQSTPQRAPELKPEVKKETFALAKVRVSPPPAFTGGRGGGPPPACSPSPAFFPTVDPSRFYVSNVTLYQLILTAYTDFRKCEPTFHDEDHISGGPTWIRSDRFEVEANFPEGSPAGKEYAEGKRAKVQEMLQALLEDRFKLVLRPQQKEMQVYLLKTAEGGARLAPSQPDELFSIGGSPARYSGPPFGHEQIQGPGSFGGSKSSSSDIASALSLLLHRPVFDRTGLTGQYTFRAEWMPTPGQQGFERIRDSGLTGPTIFEAVQTLGLRLESTKAAVGFVIDRAERPTEN